MVTMMRTASPYPQACERHKADGSQAAPLPLAVMEQPGMQAGPGANRPLAMSASLVLSSSTRHTAATVHGFTPHP